MTSDLEETCGNCRHWHRQAPPLATATRNPREDANVGACQLYPPAVTPSKWFAVSMFPETHVSRTCGSWEEKYPEYEPDDGERKPSPSNVVPLERAA